MADISTKSFDQLVFDQAAAIQAKLPSVPDMSVGTVLRALVESNAATGIWLESLILQVFAMTRASTSAGADLDSWVADFDLDPPRIPGTKSVGVANFSRTSAIFPASIPAGATVDTTDSSRSFVVVKDSSNANWDATSNAYILPISTLVLNIPVQAIAFGSAGNIKAQTLTRLTVALPYIDFVTNYAAFTGGSDQETDDQLRERFVGYIASLARGTMGAIGYAVSQVPGVSSYSIKENEDYATGASRLGHFYVIADDGTGTPSDALIDAVEEAVDEYRSAGVTFSVHKPIVVGVYTVGGLTINPSYITSDVIKLVSNAVQSYINSLGAGATLYISRVYQVIYDASDGVLNVPVLTFNGASDDILATSKQVLRAYLPNITSA
jgi:uncharacterized phage protein gp47/JayE